MTSAKQDYKFWSAVERAGQLTYFVDEEERSFCESPRIPPYQREHTTIRERVDIPIIIIHMLVHFGLILRRTFCLSVLQPMEVRVIIYVVLAFSHIGYQIKSFQIFTLS